MIAVADPTIESLIDPESVIALVVVLIAVIVTPLSVSPEDPKKTLSPTTSPETSATVIEVELDASCV